MDWAPNRKCRILGPLEVRPAKWYSVHKYTIPAAGDRLPDAPAIQPAAATRCRMLPEIAAEQLTDALETVVLRVLGEARRILREKGELVVLELDNPESLLVRLFAGFWFFYWLPFNFETPTRRDMLKYGLANEVSEAGFNNVRKISKYRGVLQIVQGEK